MIKYHPDNCNGSDLMAKNASSAFDILNKLLDALNSVTDSRGGIKRQVVKKKNLILSIDALNKLYNNETITIGNDLNRLIISRDNLDNYNVLVEFDIGIKVNNNDYDYTDMIPLSDTKEYKLSIPVNVEKLGEPMYIDISMCNETVSYKGIKSDRVEIVRRPYNGMFKITIVISKVIRKEG
jgi:hypothetical protein